MMNESLSCSNWQAWYDQMPGSKRTLHVMGTCGVPGGYSIKLERAEPQGINPDILLLNLIAEDLTPGDPNPLNIKEEEVRYREDTRTPYNQITILPDGPTISVQEVSSVRR